MTAKSDAQTGAGGLLLPGLFTRLKTGTWQEHLTTGIALLLCLPLAAIFWIALTPSENPWPHLMDTVLPKYLKNTFFLGLGVCALAGTIGFSAAWFITFFDFPGKRFFSWALLLPFAMPAYIMAYAYTDFLEYSGPVQSGLRSLMGWTSPQDYSFPEIRSLGGAILMFSLVLYPYVLLTTRAGLHNLSDNLILAGRSLGASPWQVIRRVLIPALRPSIAVGLTLVLMETLNDFGTVSYFSVQTLTFGLYDAWLSMDNLGGAAQIALVLVSVSLVVVLLEWLSRNRGLRRSPTGKHSRNAATRLQGWRAWALVAYFSLILLLGFGIPTGILATYSVIYFDLNWSDNFIDYSLNSIGLSITTVLVLGVMATFMAYVQRQSGKDRNLLIRVAMVGYGIPGAVMAIGVLVPLGAFDNSVDGWFRENMDVSTGLLLSGTAFALIYAYACRFFTVSYGSIESGLLQITPSMDQAARTLGHSPTSTLFKVHLPLLRPALFACSLIVFVDVLKELPATLLLRPFNFETLATHVYQFASDEMIHASALSALLIVLVGMIPTLLLNNVSKRDSTD